MRLQRVGHSWAHIHTHSNWIKVNFEVLQQINPILQGLKEYSPIFSFFFIYETFLRFIFNWRIIYNVVLVSAIYQHESATCPPFELPSQAPPHPSRSSQSTQLSSPYYKSNFPPRYFTYGNGYVSMLLCQLPPSLSPAVSTSQFPENSLRSLVQRIRNWDLHSGASVQEAQLGPEDPGVPVLIAEYQWIHPSWNSVQKSLEF